MTKLEIVTYECITCKKLFLRYFEVIDDNDKAFIKKMYDKDATFGDVFISGKLKCKRCDVIPLSSFGLHT